MLRGFQPQGQGWLGLLRPPAATRGGRCALGVSGCLLGVRRYLCLCRARARYQVYLFLRRIIAFLGPLGVRHRIPTSSNLIPCEKRFFFFGFYIAIPILVAALSYSCERSIWNPGGGGGEGKGNSFFFFLTWIVRYVSEWVCD